MFFIGAPPRSCELERDEPGAPQARFVVTTANQSGLCVRIPQPAHRVELVRHGVEILRGEEALDLAHLAAILLHRVAVREPRTAVVDEAHERAEPDRKSTRLNSS